MRKSIFKRRFCAVIGLLIFGAGAGVKGDSPAVNAWTKTGSGNWEDPNWSLGVMPGTNQSVLLTNSGWKAIAIGANTAQHFPQSLNVGTITLSAYTDSFNLLLLNYAGYEVPLTANALLVNSNSALTMLASALNVTNVGSSEYKLEVGGTINQGDFSSVNVSLLSLGNINPGIYNLTNGTLNVGLGYIGGSFSSVFNQFGGYVLPNPMRVMGHGEYDLYNGSLGGSVELYYGGVLKQFGGVCNAGLRMDGVYELHGGSYQQAGFGIPSAQTDFGEVYQTGGSNQLDGSLSLGIIGFGPFRPEIGTGYYILSNGVLRTSSVYLTGGGGMEQEGGLHVNQGAITITGQQIWYDAVAYGEYYLDGGTLQTDSLGIQYAGYYEQTGGTNRVASNISIVGEFSPTFRLSGGYLSSSGMGLSDGQAYQDGGIFETGGLNVFQDSYYGYQGYASYNLSGGTLLLTDLQVTGGAFHHTGGSIVHRGTLTLAGAILDEQTSGAQFGPLQVVTGSYGDSKLLLPLSNYCVVRFADSSAQSWQASLLIENWGGSLAGSGAHQVIFGANNTSLTSAQWGRLWFDNPAGLPMGLYQARPLKSGEVVPDTGIPVAPSGLGATAVASNQISLAWINRAGMATQIEVQRLSPNSNFVTVATLPPNATNYLDSGLASLTTYYYRVGARGTNGVSYSPTAVATTLPYGALPPPWTNSDIGAVGMAGKTFYDGPFRLSGSGGDIGGPADAFQFCWFTAGDIRNTEIVARITRLDNTDPGAKAGLMIRAAASASDCHAFIFLGPNGASGFLARTNYGGATTYAAGPTINVPGWVKLVIAYSGYSYYNAAITGYVSADGLNWAAVGTSSGPFVYAPLIGMAVTAHNNSALSQADFYVRTNWLGVLPGAPLLNPVFRMPDGSTRLSLNGELGRMYGIAVSTDLVHWSPWTNQLDTQLSLVFSDPGAALSSKRFYRAWVQP